MATLTCGTACLGFCLSLLISYKLCWKMLLAHSCPTLCDPMDCSLPGSCLSMGFSGVACHFLLQVIFPTQRSNLGLLHCRQIRHYLSHQGKWFSLPSCIPKSEWNSEQVTPRCSSFFRQIEQAKNPWTGLKSFSLLGSRRVNINLLSKKPEVCNCPL